MLRPMALVAPIWPVVDPRTHLLSASITGTDLIHTPVRRSPGLSTAQPGQVARCGMHWAVQGHRLQPISAHEETRLWAIRARKMDPMQGPVAYLCRIQWPAYAASIRASVQKVQQNPGRMGH